MYPGELNSWTTNKNIDWGIQTQKFELEEEVSHTTDFNWNRFQLCKCVLDNSLNHIGYDVVRIRPEEMEKIEEIVSEYKPELLLVWSALYVFIRNVSNGLFRNEHFCVKGVFFG